MYPCGRVLFTVESPVESHLERSFSCVEIAQAGETEGTGTVTHVGVECHLGLEADASGNLVVTLVVGDVVLDVQSGVLNVVAICEQLVSEVHVRLGCVIFTEVAGENLDEGEEIRIGTAHVLNVGIGDEQLVREIVGKTAVEVGGVGVDLVHLIVHRIAEQQTVLADHVVHHAGAEVRTGGGRSLPRVGVGVVVTESEMMLLADVPVDASEELDIALILVVAGVGTRIIVVLLLEEIAHFLGLCGGYAGDHAVFIGDAVLGSAPSVDLGRIRDILCVHEEEELVLDDGAAEGESVGGLTVFAPFEVHAVDTGAVEILVLVVDVSGALKGVGTGLGNGVHATADEVALANIVRGNHNLNLLDCIDGDGVATAGKSSAQTEVIVEVRTVHGEVGAAAG